MSSGHRVAGDVRSIFRWLAGVAHGTMRGPIAGFRLFAPRHFLSCEPDDEVPDGLVDRIGVGGSLEEQRDMIPIGDFQALDAGLVPLESGTEFLGELLAAHS